MANLCFTVLGYTSELILFNYTNSNNLQISLDMVIDVLYKVIDEYNKLVHENKECYVLHQSSQIEIIYLQKN